MPEVVPRVALYLYHLYGGGAERMMVNLARGLVQQGLKVDFVLNRVGGAYQDHLPPEVRIVDLKAPRLIKALPLLIAYLWRERPAVLLSTLHYTSEIALLAARLSGMPTRVVLREPNTLSLHVKLEAARNERWSPLFARLLYPWADGIVAISHGVAQDLAQITGLPQQRIRVIYSPVISPELPERARAPVEHPWFAPGEPPVVLGVGRLVEQKDFPTLIRAFARVQRTRPARLVILGKGSQRDLLKAMSRELGVEQDVALLGFVSNPYAYMARAAVFVLSSIEEGLSNVLIEAMAVGTPVISTHCESGPAEVLDHGRYGSLVPVGDSEAMAEAILEVLSGNTKIVDSAWLEQFTLEASTRQYLDVMGVAHS